MNRGDLPHGLDEKRIFNFIIDIMPDLEILQMVATRRRGGKSIESSSVVLRDVRYLQHGGTGPCINLHFKR